VGTPSILPFDATNRQQIAQGHPPDWRPPRPKDGYAGVTLILIPLDNTSQALAVL